MPKRIDQNHNVIADGLRDAGHTILSTAPLGKGAPDIVSGGLVPCPHCGVKFRQNIMLEIKNGEQPPSKRKLTEAEQVFHDTWRGQIDVAESLEEALSAIGATIN